MLRVVALILSLLLVGGLFAWQLHVGSERYPMPEPGEELTALLGELDLSTPPLSEWVRLTALDSEQSFRVQFLRRGSAERFVFVMNARDDERPTYARTRVYNVFVESASQGAASSPAVEKVLPALVKWVEHSETSTMLRPMPEVVPPDSEIQRRLDRLRRLEARKRWEIDRFGRGRLLSMKDDVRSHVEDTRWLIIAGLVVFFVFLPGLWRLHNDMLPEEQLDSKAKNFGHPFLLFAILARLSAHAFGWIPPLVFSSQRLSPGEVPPSEAFQAVLSQWIHSMPLPGNLLVALADVALFAATVYLVTYLSLRIFGQARSAIWSGALFTLAVCNWAPESSAFSLLLAEFILTLFLFSCALALTLDRPWFLILAFVLAVVVVRIHPAGVSLALLSPFIFWALVKRWEFYHSIFNWLLPLGILLFAAPLIWQHARWEPLVPVWDTWADLGTWLVAWLSSGKHMMLLFPILAFVGLVVGVKSSKKRETWMIFAAWMLPWSAGFLSPDPAIRSSIASQWIVAPCLLGGLAMDHVLTDWETRGLHDRKMLLAAGIVVAVLVPSVFLVFQ